MKTTVKSKATLSREMNRRNLLLRYQAIMDEFNRHDVRYTPIAVIWREFIYPKFFISRKTLYHILNTDVETELKAIDL
nr:hypothetical protein [uncultured Capnocytophaga sp.]